VNTHINLQMVGEEKYRKLDSNNDEVDQYLRGPLSDPLRCDPIGDWTFTTNCYPRHSLGYNRANPA